jgi:hypothetical protein
MARTRHLFETDSTRSSLKEYDPSAVSGRTKTPVSNSVQLAMIGYSVKPLLYTNNRIRSIPAIMDNS